MNEDERGITPADVTAITIDLIRGDPRADIDFDRVWRVIIEQGNGDLLKDIELTEMEFTQLGLMLVGQVKDCSFIDFRPVST